MTDVDVKPDDEYMEVLYSQKIASSDVAKWQKEDVKRTSGDPNAKALLLVIYWDGTSKDLQKKFSMCPVYVGVAQIDPEHRRKWYAKRHVGFLPHPLLNTASTAPKVSPTQLTKDVQMFGRELYQLALRYMLEPLAYFQWKGLDFKTQEGPVIKLVPRLAHFTGDIPEGML